MKDTIVRHKSGHLTTLHLVQVISPVQMSQEPEETKWNR